MQVWDMSFFLNSLAESGAHAHDEEDKIHKHLPLKVFSGHKDEGYAIDWSPLVTGRLVSGVYLILSVLQIVFHPEISKCFCIL
jgi:ribosome assembly protein RRB1